MELSDLRSFVDVAERLNIRRAAMAAGVQPSTLSRRIARIEGELGVSVFERHASGVRLTRAGRDFFDTASNAIRDLDFKDAPRLKGSWLRELNDAAGAYNAMLDGLKLFETYVPRALVSSEVLMIPVPATFPS